MSKQKINPVQQENLQILETLRAYAYMHPDMRFYQLLATLGITKRMPMVEGRMALEDRFYDRSSEILKDVQDANHKLALQRWDGFTGDFCGGKDELSDV